MDLFSTREVQEAVASFNMESLHLSFDAEYFPFPPNAERNAGEDVSLLSAIREAGDTTDRWSLGLSNVPTPILAHELSHVFQTATTPSGLRHFFESFVLENYLGVTIGDARRHASSLPVGLTDFFKTDLSRRSSACNEATMLEEVMALRIGGLRAHLDDLTLAEQFTTAFPQSTFFVMSEDIESGAATATALGTRHIYEGFGAAVQTVLSSSASDLLAMPAEPYHICVGLYKQTRPGMEHLRGTLLEFAVVLDTALLEDQWYNLNGQGPTSGKVFMRLLEELDRHPELTLESMHHKDVGAFQNSLMRLAEFRVPDVGEVCLGLRNRLTSIFDEIKVLTSTPPYILDDYFECIDTFQRFRQDYFDGACPLELFLSSDRVWLTTLVSNVPSATNGYEWPVLHSHKDNRDVFIWQQARHFRPVLEEIVFGARPCGVRSTCTLPKRPACTGVTGHVVRMEERCAREAVIVSVMSHWEIDQLEAARPTALDD